MDFRGKDLQVWTNEGNCYTCKSFPQKSIHICRVNVWNDTHACIYLLYTSCLPELVNVDYCAYHISYTVLLIQTLSCVLCWKVINIKLYEALFQLVISYYFHNVYTCIKWLGVIWYWFLYGPIQELSLLKIDIEDKLLFHSLEIWHCHFLEGYTSSWL